MKKYQPIYSLLLLLNFISTDAISQNIPGQYINEALSNNLVLQEKKVSLEKSLIALKEAKSMFLPTTWFEGQYTLAQGGRDIDIPVGDLLNPVYKTLNQLTGSNGFPTVSNVSEQFNPNNFYDLRIKTTMPVINPALRINRDIKQQQVALQQNEVDIYKRELIKDIKTAYYQFLLAGKAIGIYENALVVVNQNLRLNQSLLKNGKGLPAYVARAESEVKQVEAQLQTARNEQRNAQAYFNFLLNRALTDSIIIEDIHLPDNYILPAEPITDNINNREELKSLYLAKDINGKVLKLNQSFRVPRLNLFLDLAAQGFDFNMNQESFFYLGGLQMQIPIFAGKRNLYKISETQLDAKNIGLQTKNTTQQLQMAAFTSRNAAITAYTNYRASLKQEEAAQKYFKLIDRGYSEGVNSFIEFLDARNQLTRAQLQMVITKYRVLSALADYERQTASYSFN